MRTRLLALFPAVLVLGACVPYSTGETEIGVLVCTVGIGCADGKGVQNDLYPPGSTTFFAPFIRDFYVFDTKVQNLTMKQDKGGESHNDLEFKTTDGNDIEMDVTVVWTIESKLAPKLLQTVGSSTHEIREKLVRPVARTIVRDVLNELDSESVYNADKRFEKAEKAREELTARLTPYGVQIQQVILHEHRFNPEYEKVIHDRKLAEQRAQQLKSEAEAAVQEALRNLESSRGKVASEIAAATGDLEKQKLDAEASLYQAQQSSDAIVAERAAKAQGIQKRNEALRGSGGRAMVKLKIAEALAGKRIVLIPGGESAIGINRLDLNRLIIGNEATASK